MVDTLKLDLEYCYGIGKFSTEIEFKHKGFAIYAPNGVMKTSLAKTLMDLSKGKTPSDLAFPERDTKCNIYLNDNAIPEDEIFVVHSYDKDYSSESISTLLANNELKKQYEKAHKSIAIAKKNLDRALRVVSGYGPKSREKVDKVVERIFGGDYYDAILRIENELKTTRKEIYADANYKIIFDPKNRNFLEQKDVGSALEDFAKKYHELTEKSPILNKEFRYHNISHIHRELTTNSFFDAGHSVNLVDSNDQKKLEFKTSDALLEKIKAEKQRVITDDELAKKFEELNSKLEKNKQLQELREYITNNQHLLPELNNLEAFERKLWLQYFLSCNIEFDDLLEKYKAGQNEIARVISLAKNNPNDWDIVIENFNTRFSHLPFELTVSNKTDAILNESAPSIEFTFKDGLKEKTYGDNQKNELLGVLSTGESRALYILQIMFETYVRWKNRKKTLFVFDDIADSFDYKNKFAVIDYLESITKTDDIDFLILILTHNFDLLRTIESRGICPTHQCRMAFRKDGEITLKKFRRTDIRNPFHRWQADLSEPVIQMAFIPFLRNVIEYTQGSKDAYGNDNPDYLELTYMLHFKGDNAGKTIGQYKAIFERTFPNINFPSLVESSKIFDTLFQTANDCLNETDGINLEHKIVLSMAIRIHAEKYIVSKILSTEPDYDYSKKQTGELIQKFKLIFNNQTEEIKVMNRVGLITPSNIHLNAFMYEPILDMGFDELKNLYQDVKAKLA